MREAGQLIEWGPSTYSFAIYFKLLFTNPPACIFHNAINHLENISDVKHECFSAALSSDWTTDENVHLTTFKKSKRLVGNEGLMKGDREIRGSGK